MIFFWILWGFDALVTLVILYFFFYGLTDGTVSSYNLAIWLFLLALPAAVLYGSIQLMKHEHLIAAKLVLCILAVPGFLYGIFILAMLNVKNWQ